MDTTVPIVHTSPVVYLMYTNVDTVYGLSAPLTADIHAPYLHFLQQVLLLFKLVLCVSERRHRHCSPGDTVHAAYILFIHPLHYTYVLCTRLHYLHSWLDA